MMSAELMLPEHSRHPLTAGGTELSDAVHIDERRRIRVVHGVLLRAGGRVQAHDESSRPMVVPVAVEKLVEEASIRTRVLRS